MNKNQQFCNIALYFETEKKKKNVCVRGRGDGVVVKRSVQQLYH